MRDTTPHRNRVNEDGHGKQLARQGQKMPKRKRQSQNRFAAFGCDKLAYEFSFKLEAIRLDEFRQAVGEMAGEEYERDRGTVHGSFANKTQADYHVHFWFRWTKVKFQATLEYFSGYAKPDAEDRGPFTEDMMKWFGGFVKSGQSEASVSAYMSHRLTRGTALALPLPMLTHVRGRGISVTGMTFTPASKLNGVYEIFASVIRGGELLAIASAEKQVTFTSLDVINDLETIAHVARLYLEVET